jgi:hypothetical protein
MDFNKGSEYLYQQQAMAKAVTRHDDHSWKAPDAAHALAWLRIEIYGMDLFTTKGAESDKGTEYHTTKRIFRGQGDSCWKIQPGIFRLDLEDRVLEEKAATIFSKVVENLFSMVNHATEDNWPPLNLKSGKAVAQHYGLFTPLVDWTVNPCVAVDMATNIVKEDKKQYAAVYWINFKDVEELGIEIILPPVFAYRLYLQRGFFTNATEEQLLFLNQRVQKIIFPLEYHHRCEAMVMSTNEKVKIDLLPVNKWFEQLRIWSKVKAYHYEEKENDGIPLHIRFSSDFRKFTFKYPMELHTLFDGGDIHLLVQDYVRQLAARHVRNSDEAIYDARIIKVLRQFNENYFKWTENVLRMDYSKSFIWNFVDH